MKTTLQQLFEYQKLSFSEAREALHNIAAGKFNHAHITAFLSVYMMRPVTVEELQGFRAALLELCRPVDLSDFEAIDLCGTGGDGKNTFNVSTLTAFVLAGAGFKVAKHGNYGVSSVCGSSNVMEYLGYTFSNDQDQLYRQLDRNNLTFLHAPLFHPAMKAVAPVRRELGMKTFFNMLGPLVNPARPQYQLVGVFNLELARLYKYILQQGQQSYTIVHSLDGYDEVSLTSGFRSITRETDNVLQPKDLGLEKLSPESLHGGKTIAEAAQIFLQILDGQGTQAQNSVVAANAALAMRMLDGTDLETGVARAQETLANGKAKIILSQLIENSK